MEKADKRGKVGLNSLYAKTKQRSHRTISGNRLPHSTCSCQRSGKRVLVI